MAFDRAIAAITIFCEASSASPAERRAIAHVLFNRQHDGRFGATVAEVCLRRMQFSEWNGDKPDNINLLRAARVAELSPAMLDCSAAFDEAFQGSRDTTNGATHYHDKSIAPPDWTAGATVTLDTAKFIFYAHVA